MDIPYTRCTRLNGGRLEYSGPSGEVVGWFAEGPRFEPAAAGWFIDAVLRLQTGWPAFRLEVVNAELSLKR